MRLRYRSTSDFLFANHSVPRNFDVVIFGVFTVEKSSLKISKNLITALHVDFLQHKDYS